MSAFTHDPLINRRTGVMKRTVCPQCHGKKYWESAVCRRCYVPVKPLAGRYGPAHPTWKGGTRFDKDGYLKRYAPDHPWPRRGGYVREHDRVMELEIGRRLEPGEVVHHKDHNRLNNDLANLEIMMHRDHSRLHRHHDQHLRQRDALGRYTGKEVMQHA